MTVKDSTFTAVTSVFAAGTVGVEAVAFVSSGMIKPQIVWKIKPEEMVARWFIPAFDAVIDELIAAFDEAMDSEIWNWDRPTRRRANPSPGAIVTSPRSITDTGDLRESLVTVKVRELYYQFVWQAAHAAIVLLGKRRADGTNQPGRDWISEGLSQVNIVELYAQEIRRRMG